MLPGGPEHDPHLGQTGAIGRARQPLVGENPPRRAVGHQGWELRCLALGAILQLVGGCTRRRPSKVQCLVPELGERVADPFQRRMVAIVPMTLVAWFGRLAWLSVEKPSIGASADRNRVGIAA